MRSLLYVLAALILLPACLAQTAVPPWPQITFDSCPALGENRDPSQRMWKHGEPERNSFTGSFLKLQSKDYTAAAEGAAKFAAEYPDSDYFESALLLQIGALGYLKDKSSIVRVAQQLVLLPTAEPGNRETAFVTLLDTVTPYVRPDDPQKDRKLADLEKWTHCGEEAMAADTRTPNMSKDVFESHRKTSEDVLDRTAGFVAYMRQDYVLANSKFEAAAKLNPQDARTYLLLSLNKFFSPVPDSNSGIFYLARCVDLVRHSNLAEPGAQENSVAFLKQMYVIIHGSEKGLLDVQKLAATNTDPPPGFNVLPKPKTSHHYGTVIATAAVVGLLIYGAASHPEWMQAIGQSLGQPGQSQERKLMIFGGPDHRTYLGCLSCLETGSDSVFNEFGEHGSRYRPESIWNRYGQFGSSYSPYSACNELATDPPVIVDQGGTAYGRLTVNRVNRNIGMGTRFYDWLTSDVCHN
jgi:hypothetical protein